MLYFQEVGGEGITITNFEDGDGGFDISANPGALQFFSGDPIDLGPPFVPEASTTFEGNSKKTKTPGNSRRAQACMHFPVCCRCSSSLPPLGNDS